MVFLHKMSCQNKGHVLSVTVWTGRWAVAAEGLKEKTSLQLYSSAEISDEHNVL